MPNQLVDVSRKAEYWKWRQHWQRGARSGDGTVWLIIRLSGSPEHLQFTSQSPALLPSGEKRSALLPSLHSSSSFSPAILTSGNFRFHFAEAILAFSFYGSSIKRILWAAIVELRASREINPRAEILSLGLQAQILLT